MILSAAGAQTGAKLTPLAKVTLELRSRGEVEQPQIGRSAVALCHGHDQLSAVGRERRIRIERRTSDFANDVACAIEPDESLLFVGRRADNQESGPRNGEIHLVAEPVVLHRPVGYGHGLADRFEPIRIEPLRNQRIPCVKDEPVR